METNKTNLATPNSDSPTQTDTATLESPDILHKEATQLTPEADLPREVPLSEEFPQDKISPSTGKLIFSLICVILAAVGVIIYGVTVVKSITGDAVPVGEFLLGEVFGSRVAALGHTYAMPPLIMIPPQTVLDGISPGAAEEETVDDGFPPTVPSENAPVKVVDLSVGEDIFSIINETPYSPDTSELFFRESAIPRLNELYSEYGEDAPVVLIIHTHGTESYLEEGTIEVSPEESFRTSDPEESVVAVGRRIKEILEGYGIGVIHTEKMFDLEDFNSAYVLAAEHIVDVCEKYPSVSYVFDIHRDAMITADGTHLKPTSVNPWGEVYPAQLMFVVGTDYAGSGHASWEDNFSLALKMQAGCTALDPALMRPLNLRSASFNQQYTKGSLIVEVGAAAGTLKEAIAAGEIFAHAAAKVIVGE